MFFIKKRIARTFGESKNNCSDHWGESKEKRQRLNHNSHKKIGVSYQENINLKIIQEEKSKDLAIIAEINCPENPVKVESKKRVKVVVKLFVLKIGKNVCPQDQQEIFLR